MLESEGFGNRPSDSAKVGGDFSAVVGLGLGSRAASPEAMGHAHQAAMVAPFEEVVDHGHSAAGGMSTRETACSTDTRAKDRCFITQPEFQ